MLKALLSLVLALLAITPALAGDGLTLTFGDEEKRFTASDLLARSDAATIEIPDDVSYKRAMRYRAVPLLALIGGAAQEFDTLEARAADGFVSQIPLELVEKGGSVAWVAVEDPQNPWPHLPGKDVSAGPFYIVWQHPERSGVGTELWPYQTVAITGTESPAHRWPQMRVAGDLPADAPARHGQAVFTMQCMPCHRMKGAGAAEVGPDLGQPMNPTQYLTPQGLRALIRDPKSVRTWPQQQMPGFSEKALSDADLDAVIAYLSQMARQ
ncbi:MAG: c-type cytochrome [Hyphomicrobium sp.]|jgi:mono/diheme cytochrome c family protein